MTTPTAFTPQSAQRIADAVKQVESQPVSRGGQPLPPPPVTQTKLWAMLTGFQINGLMYSWVQAKPLPSGGFTIDLDGVRGDHNAFEINSRIGVPPNTVVEMTFAGYIDDDPEQPWYSFRYDPQTQHMPLPPHNHASNYDGAFAFGVYHPGTAVPQMPWSI